MSQQRSLLHGLCYATRLPLDVLGCLVLIVVGSAGLAILLTNRFLNGLAHGWYHLVSRFCCWCWPPMWCRIGDGTCFDGVLTPSLWPYLAPTWPRSQGVMRRLVWCFAVLPGVLHLFVATVIERVAVAMVGLLEVLDSLILGGFLHAFILHPSLVRLIVMADFCRSRALPQGRLFGSSRQEANAAPPSAIMAACYHFLMLPFDDLFYRQIVAEGVLPASSDATTHGQSHGAISPLLAVKIQTQRLLLAICGQAKPSGGDALGWSSGQFLRRLWFVAAMVGCVWLHSYLAWIPTLLLVSRVAMALKNLSDYVILHAFHEYGVRNGLVSDLRLMFGRKHPLLTWILFGPPITSSTLLAAVWLVPLLEPHMSMAFMFMLIAPLLLLSGAIYLYARRVWVGMTQLYAQSRVDAELLLQLQDLAAKIDQQLGFAMPSTPQEFSFQNVMATDSKAKPVLALLLQPSTYQNIGPGRYLQNLEACCQKIVARGICSETDQDELLRVLRGCTQQTLPSNPVSILKHFLCPGGFSRLIEDVIQNISYLPEIDVKDRPEVLAFALFWRRYWGRHDDPAAQLIRPQLLEHKTQWHPTEPPGCYGIHRPVLNRSINELSSNSFGMINFGSGFW